MAKDESAQYKLKIEDASLKVVTVKVDPGVIGTTFIRLSGMLRCSVLHSAPQITRTQGSFWMCPDVTYLCFLL
ncbi:hypothetical protein, partial [Solemya velum gill symbiont]|uniref:hypothetical protein n=1 Tax=Solemya velum gill symbiont TaxID=2340 RepID=UPI001E2B9F71